MTTDPLQSAVRHEASQVETAMRADLDNALSGCDPLLQEIIHYGLFGGGKRMRPVLAVFSHWACGGSDPAIYKLATAFEYLHTATLLHDDVIDHAPQRRGRSSLWHQYGIAAAILAGDWLHSRSTLLIGEMTGIPGLTLFSCSNTAMVDGEFLQLRSTARPDTSEEQYFAVIQRKTALLIATTCTISALFSQASTAHREALHRYGLALGNAFQVVDDLLDYTGVQKNTGKTVGNDFLEGKITLPLIYAMQGAAPEHRQAMEQLLEKERDRPQNFASMQTLIRETGGLRAAKTKAKALISEALSHLEDLDPAPSATAGRGLAMLRSLALYIIERDH